jgi:small subunit ribosomal protein S16
MAVVIRLKRMGAVKKPVSRIVVADSRCPRDGRFIEEVGYCDMRKNPYEVKIKRERIEHWLKNGARPSATVKSFLKKEKII